MKKFVFILLFASAAGAGLYGVKLFAQSNNTGFDYSLDSVYGRTKAEKSQQMLRRFISNHKDIIKRLKDMADDIDSIKRDIRRLNK